MKVVTFSLDYVDGPRYYKAGDTARVRDVLAVYLVKSGIATGDGMDAGCDVMSGSATVRFNYSRKISGRQYQAGDIATVPNDLTLDWLKKYGIVSEVSIDEPIGSDDAISDTGPVPHKRRGRPRKEV